MIYLSEGVVLLVYDTALATDTSVSPEFNIFYTLHTTPSRIGQVAHAAGVKDSCFVAYNSTDRRQLFLILEKTVF